MSTQDTGPLAAGRRIALAVLTFTLLTASAALAQKPAHEAELKAAKASLEKYENWVTAVRDGYLSSVGCVQFPEPGKEGEMQYVAGGMGIHFINMGNVGPELDPAKPQVLLYEPTPDGLKLAGAEWFMPVAVAGDQRPSIFGRELDGPMEGHEPLLPAELHHYDLHVWLWKKNPAGMFSPTNPAIECPADAYTFDEIAPKMVGHHGH